MLQNRCKGIYFFRNNQKKTHKKSQTCHIFSICVISVNYFDMVIGGLSEYAQRILYNINSRKEHDLVFLIMFKIFISILVIC